MSDVAKVTGQPARASSRRRIVFVVNDARWFMTHRLPIAEAARSAGYEVHVATPPGPFTRSVEESGFEWHEVSFARGAVNPAAQLRTFLSFWRLYRRLRPDLVHHVSAKPVLYGTVAARLTGTPAIVNAVTGLGHLFIATDLLHRTLRLAVGAAYRLILRHRRLRVLFQNEDDRAIFVESGWVRREDTVLVRSGVDTAAFRPREGRKDGPPVVILPARLIRTKGVAEFVAAAARLKQEGVNARFVLVGAPDPQNPACISDAVLEEWSRGGVVELWGERHDMPAVYDEADVVVLPSYREGMPKTLLEASSAGLPVITTDAPGCRDVVRAEETGYLVPVGDVDNLTEHLRRLVGDSDLRYQVGARGREHILATFSIHDAAQRTVAIYDELLA